MVLLTFSTGQVDALSEAALETINRRGDDLAENCLLALRKQNKTFDDDFLDQLASQEKSQQPDNEAKQQVLSERSNWVFKKEKLRNFIKYDYELRRFSKQVRRGKNKDSYS